jgi:hypothetical protein
MESTAAEALGFGTNGNLFDPQIERNRAPVRTDHDAILVCLKGVRSLDIAACLLPAAFSQTQLAFINAMTARV